MELAFFIGLLSSLHCFGMCGGVVGALTMSLPADIRQQTGTLFRYTLAYNTGRILSYSLAGLVVGFLGQTVINFAPEAGTMLLRTLFLIFVIVLGLYVGGWLPGLALVEKLGQPVWKKLQPIGTRFLPVKTVQHAFLFGTIWGWLPCGLVYYALMMAFSRQDAASAALFMLAFGLGTLLPMLFAGIMAGKLVTLRNSVLLRKVNAFILILIGISGLLLMRFPEITRQLYYLKY